MKDLLRLWRLLAPHRSWLLLGFLAALATLIANVTLMAVSGWFITAMAVAGVAGTAMNYFTPAAVIRASAMARTGGRYLERLVTHEATLRLLSDLRVWFYRRLEPLAPARLQQLHSGDLLSRIRADIDALDNFYIRVLVPLAVALVSLALFFGFLLLYDTGLALAILGFLLFAGIAVPLWTLRRGAAPGRRLVQAQSQLREAALDGIQGLPELLVYGAAEAHAQQLDGISRALTAEQQRMSRYNGLSQALVSASANLALWTLLWLGIPLVGAGRLPPPDLAMLALFTLASFEAVAPLPQAFQQLGTTLAAARRLFAIADMPPAVTEPAGPSPRPERFDLTLRGVTFAYPGAARPALADIDLDLPQGGRVAVVGATGSGKSTLLNLLLRFWEPDAGRIELGGHDLAAFRGEDLRCSIAVVSQHTHLFNATIRENLLLADPDAPQNAVEAACRIAQIHDFIAALPEGYDTWVGETGVRVSGGEARRIAIARALLTDAPVLLLDEPTEGLDAATEHSLLAALGRLMEGRTVLLITHRPAGLEGMDRILLLDDGRILEQGTHAEMVRAEHFRRLLRLT